MAPRDGDGAAGSPRHLFKGAAIRTQRPFILGATVDVIEHGARKPPLRRAPQIFDVENPRRFHRSSLVMLSGTKHPATSTDCGGRFNWELRANRSCRVTVGSLEVAGFFAPIRMTSSIAVAPVETSISSEDRKLNAENGGSQ